MLFFQSLKVLRVFLGLVLLLVTSPLFSADPYNPIAVYLTWTKSPETTMSIQWISKREETENNVYYRIFGAEDTSFITKTATHKAMPQGWPYLIHQVELTDLEPGTVYAFKISAEGRLFKFKTIPKELTEVRFVEGGDVYHDKIEFVAKMNSVAAKLDPMFAVIGGDIAYSADSSHGLFPEEFPRWLKWFSTWTNTMVTPGGFLIPILPVIGNHDTKGGHGQSPMDAPFFYAFFPMPGSQGYNVLDFGNYMSLLLLDSGHTHPVGGAQTEWIANTLKSRQNIPYKFAVYHVPAYPSYRKFSSERSEIIRKHWVPVFEAFSLRAAFENHDHTYKRTFPLRNNKNVENGVVYLGDGGWGVEKPRNPRKGVPYLAKALASSNIIFVTLNNEGVKYEAFNSQGEAIDRYEQKK